MKVFTRRIFRPRPHVAGYFGKQRLFSPNISTVHTYPVFSGTENGGFQIRSPGGGDFWKRRFIVFVWMCENGGFQIRWRHTIRKRYLWTQIFLNTEKKTSVFENTQLRVDGQIRLKNATCRWTQLSFKYGGKNLRFRKYPATCGRGLNFLCKCMNKFKSLYTIDSLFFLC